MNYGLPNETANELHPAVTAVDLKARLYEDFALALHAMAQPLTVLRGATGLLKLRGASGPDADRYLEMSHTQVERLCSLMEGMRSLLDNVQCVSASNPTNLWELVESVLDDEGSYLTEAGLRISAAQTGHDIHVLADPILAGHAIKAALRAITAVSQKGDTIYLTVNPRDGFGDLMVHTLGADGKRLGSIERFHLSVAEVSIRNQHGFFECLSDPFRVSLKFPLHDHKDEHFGSAEFSTSTQQTR